ncbi:MAG: hypothetical protein GVY06_07545 [Alphaproteobacteria bacterium]|jgi:hypothetical protein|nr:hypothetical protein [Alphaproteobacteria bacterium]
MLGACGALAADLSAYEEEVRTSMPLEPSIAVANTFYFCRDVSGDETEIICEACDATLHEVEAGSGALSGFRATATHFVHTLTPPSEGGPPRLGLSDERGSERFETGALTLEAAHSVFREANDWCRRRKAGNFQMRKDAIEAFFQEADF